FFAFFFASFLASHFERFKYRLKTATKTVTAHFPKIINYLKTTFPSTGQATNETVKQVRKRTESKRITQFCG
ncbi:MAG: hypothetical protein V1850_03820, partial [Candidatus Bathyarchaeota archaeon]